MEVPYSPVLVGPDSDGQTILGTPQPATFTQRFVIVIVSTVEEANEYMAEMLRFVFEERLIHTIRRLARRYLDLKSSLFGKPSIIDEGLGAPPIGSPGSPFFAGDLPKGYVKWPEEPNIWKRGEDKTLLKGHEKWPEEPDIRLTTVVETFPDISVLIDGDPDPGKDPLPDPGVHTTSDYSKASHCPECDGTGECSCSYVS